MPLEELERRPLAEADVAEDNRRLYRLTDGRRCEVQELGKFRATDIEEPLVL